jgi:hypothetical protein
MSKYDVIANGCYNDTGFGSIKSVLKDAREKGPFITLKDASEWNHTRLDRVRS